MCRITTNNKIKRPDENQVFGGDDRDRTDYLLNAIHDSPQVETEQVRFRNFPLFSREFLQLPKTPIVFIALLTLELLLEDSII